MVKSLLQKRESHDDVWPLRTLCMIVWNCNGSLRTDVGYFEDIAMYIQRPNNACLINSLMYKDIDESQYIVPNYELLGMLEPKKRCKHNRVPNGISISYT